MRPGSNGVREAGTIRHVALAALGAALQKDGLVLEVRMSRFKTRLRRQSWVEVRLPDGRRITGSCVYQQGKTAHVAKMRWSGSGGALRGQRECGGGWSRQLRDAASLPEPGGLRSCIGRTVATPSGCVLFNLAGRGRRPRATVTHDRE